MKIVEINGVAPPEADEAEREEDQDSDQNNTQMSFGEINQDDLNEGNM